MPHAGVFFAVLGQTENITPNGWDYWDDDDEKNNVLFFYFGARRMDKMGLIVTFMQHFFVRLRS